MRRKKSSSPNVTPQDNDIPLAVSDSLVKTESWQQKHLGSDNFGDDDVYAPYRLDLGTLQVRILTSFPAHDKDAPLEGPLRTAELGHETARYEALSYIWGEVDKKCSLRVHNGMMHVSTNLFGALQRLRDTSEPRDLWVDTIRIDQDTTEEKTHQVQRIFQVYRNAERVLMWLGDAGEDGNYVTPSWYPDFSAGSGLVAVYGTLQSLVP